MQGFPGLKSSFAVPQNLPVIQYSRIVVKGRLSVYPPTGWIYDKVEGIGVAGSNS